MRFIPGKAIRQGTFIAPNIPFWYRIIDCATSAIIAISLQTETLESIQARIAWLNSLHTTREGTAIDRCDRSCLHALHQLMSMILVFLGTAGIIAGLTGPSRPTTSHANGTFIDVTIKGWPFPYFNIVIRIDRRRAARHSRRCMRGGLGCARVGGPRRAGGWAGRGRALGIRINAGRRSNVLFFLTCLLQGAELCRYWVNHIWRWRRPSGRTNLIRDIVHNVINAVCKAKCVVRETLYCLERIKKPFS